MDTFTPIFRFIACSDLHISGYEGRNADRLRRLYQTAYRYADSQPYNHIDAMLIAGDFADSGKPQEYENFKRITAENKREETALIYVMGNHEYGTGRWAFEECMKTPFDVHEVVRGFHFIGVSPSSENEDYNKDCSDWMKREVAIAAKDDPRRPIFTFQHHHLADTVYVSKSWKMDESEAFREAFSPYPQVFNFSGHSHGPVNNPLSIWQDDFTMLGCGTLNCFEMELGVTCGTIPPGSENAAQYYIVELDENYHTRILPFNIITDDFFKEPGNASEEKKQLIYDIPRPWDKSSFKYTKERYKTEDRPYFDADAESKLKIDKITPFSAEITLPTARDKSCIYSYNVKLTPKNTSAAALNAGIYAEYFLEPIPEMLSSKLNSLDPDTEYAVEVYPVNIWDKVGEPIRTEFRTEGYDYPEYKSENKVSFKGTFTDFESVSELRRSDSNALFGGENKGDVFLGICNSSRSIPSPDGEILLCDGKGYNNSKAVGIRINETKNYSCFILLADEINKFTTSYPHVRYLRMWLDFTDVEMRKFSPGIIDGSNKLFFTDGFDGSITNPFYYLPDSEPIENGNWQTFHFGSDGCIGKNQHCPVKGMKGWFAFPMEYIASGNGKVFFCGSEITGFYIYFDYDSRDYLTKTFYLDEIHLTDDFRKFEKI